METDVEIKAHLQTCLVSLNETGDVQVLWELDLRTRGQMVWSGELQLYVSGIGIFSFTWP